MMICRRIFFILLLTVVVASPNWGQERKSALTLGLGSQMQWDTYLSNEKYRGSALSLLSMKSRPTHWFDRRLYVQHQAQGELGYTKQREGNHKDLSGMFHWQVAWHYHFLPVESSWELNAGPGVRTNLGFVYNTMGGNNPASARWGLHVVASGQIKRHLNIKSQKLTASLQTDIPLSGIIFSPYYGQSYYEIFSLGQYHHNICYTHPLEALQANTLLTLDWHLRPTTSLRLVYQGLFMQSKANGLKTQSFSNSFMIGYVRNF